MFVSNDFEDYLNHMAEEMCLTLKVDQSFRDKVKYRLDRIYRQAFEDCREQVIVSMGKIKPKKFDKRI
jgi:hypothetical protein